MFAVPFKITNISDLDRVAHLSAVAESKVRIPPPWKYCKAAAKNKCPSHQDCFALCQFPITPTLADTDNFFLVCTENCNETIL